MKVNNNKYVTLILALSFINVSYATDIFDTVNKPTSTASKVQSATNMPDNSNQKKCSTAGRVLKCVSTAGSGTINRDNSTNSIGNFNIPPPTVNTSPPPAYNQNNYGSNSNPTNNPPGNIGSFITPGQLSPIGAPLNSPNFNPNGGPPMPIILSTNGKAIPNQSKEGSKYGAVIPGSGGGMYINAHPVNTSLCAGRASPQLNKLFLHNLNFDDYAHTAGNDRYSLYANEALIYRFIPVAEGNVGSFNFGEATNAARVPTYATLSQTPCDWPTDKMYRGSKPDADFCYNWSGSHAALNYKVTNGAVSWGQCKVIPGKVYYLNIRFLEPLPNNNLVNDLKVSTPGANNSVYVDACQRQTNGDGRVCGGIFQITGSL